MSAHILTAIDLLKWPFVFLIIGIVAILAFRSPLSSVIRRLKKLKAPYIEAEAAEQVQAQVQGQSPMPGATGQFVTSSAANDSMMSGILMEVSRAILNDPIVKATPQGDARDDLLAKHLASFQIAVFFERVYQYIFGSQIQAVRLANRHMGANLKDLHELFDGTWLDDGTFTFEHWMKYIRDYAQFVTVDGDLVMTTERGSEFLKYLVQMHYSEKDRS